MKWRLPVSESVHPSRVFSCLWFKKLG